MIAVGLSSSAVRPYLAGHEQNVDVAAINSPASLTLSGDPGALATISAALGGIYIYYRWQLKKNNKIITIECNR